MGNCHPCRMDAEQVTAYRIKQNRRLQKRDRKKLEKYKKKDLHKKRQVKQERKRDKRDK